MKWATISVQRLRDYEKRKLALENIPAQIQTLEDQIFTIKSSATDKIVVKGTTNKKEDALIDNIAEREELKNNYRIAKREVELTEKGLKATGDEGQRILELFYINRPYDYIEKLCEELCVERSRVSTLKDKALRDFTLAIYGIVEL